MKYFLSLLLISCAITRPSPYSEHQIIVDEKSPYLKKSVFSGNHETSSLTALTYSYVAASEYCKLQKRIPVIEIPVQENKDRPKFIANFACLEVVKGFWDVEKLKETKEGVIIQSLNELEKSPFLKNDMIVSINDQKVSTLIQIPLYIGTSSNPHVTIMRGYKVLTVTPKVGDHSLVHKMFDRGMVKALCEKIAKVDMPPYCLEVIASF